MWEIDNTRIENNPYPNHQKGLLNFVKKLILERGGEREGREERKRERERERERDGFVVPLIYAFIG